MRPLFVVLIASAALALPARAERLDLATVKCSEFFASGADNIARTMMWLEGYYSEENASPIIDFDKMKADETKIRDYCAANPNDSLITSAEKSMSK